MSFAYQALAVKKIHKQFGRIQVLKDLSFNVAKGEIFGIVGKSGAGKTTLIHCLNGLEKPDQGEIWIEDDPVFRQTGLALQKSRQKIGMVFQQFYLFNSRTAIENICYPLEIAAKDGDPYGLLKLVGLEGKENLYPAQLSGGQKQRVAIARALALNPQLLLCDEPTSALDPETTQSILQLLRKLNEQLGITIILITHQMEVIRQVCHRVAVLDNGGIVEEGRTIDVFAKPQHSATQALLARASHSLVNLCHQKSNSKLLQLCFPTGLAERGLISEMIKAFDVEVNILLGSIDVLVQGRIGHLVIELKGSVSELAKAEHFLQHVGVLIHKVQT